MSTFKKIEKKCSVCGKTSEFNVLTSTNSFGSCDLDLRPPQMRRSTMWSWVEKCPHCNYVSSSIIEGTSLPKEYFSSNEYLSCENISFPSDLADNFYKHYMIKKLSGNYYNAYSALLHCAWVCDDYHNKELSYLMREKMVDLYDKLPKSIKLNKNLVVQFADILRRCGKFDEVIEKFSDYKTKDEVIDKVVKFQVRLAKNKDDKAYTVRDVLND